MILDTVPGYCVVLIALHTHTHAHTVAVIADLLLMLTAFVFFALINAALNFYVMFFTLVPSGLPMCLSKSAF